MAREKDPRLNSSGRYVAPAGFIGVAALTSMYSRLSSVEIVGAVSKEAGEVPKESDTPPLEPPTVDPRRSYFPRTSPPAVYPPLPDSRPYPGRLPVRNLPLDTSS